VDLGLPFVEVSRSQSDTSHSVRLLWTRDWPVAETSIWQHTTITRDRHKCHRAGFEPATPANEQQQTRALDLSAAGIGNRTVYVKAIKRKLGYPIILCRSKFTFQNYPYVTLEFAAVQVSLLTPNDYSGHTTQLISKCCILYIYSTNIGTEYFKHGIYSPYFPLQSAVCFINLTYLVPVLFTFYIQGVLKLKKKNNSGAKRLIQWHVCISRVYLFVRDFGFCLIVKNAVNAHLDFGFKKLFWIWRMNRERLSASPWACQKKRPRIFMYELQW